MDKFTVHWDWELFFNWLIYFGLILSMCAFCYIKGYDKRSKELETDFEFEKEKEEIK